MNKSKKILATIGPSSMEKSIIENMDASGVDIFRVNLSHTEIKDFEDIIKNIRQWTKRPICIDTEGAQIRTGKIINGKFKAKTNSIVSLTSAEVLKEGSSIPLYPIIPQQVLRLGDILAIDFHSVIVQVIEIKQDCVLARVLSGGEVSSNRAVSIDRWIDLPSLTQKDFKILELSRQKGLNHFALSFAGKKQDIDKLREFFPYPIFLISKIESKLGLKNLEEICEASDAILIDRGDLSREVPLQKIALAQKYILDTADKTKTPVYVATNLLETMVSNFTPSRAEINDITSTLISGAEGLVLASETAIGRHPIQAVRMVSAIKKEVEDYISSDKKTYLESIYDYNLIEPHGGVLVQNFLNGKEIEKIKNLAKILVDDRILSDIIQIAEGTYSPLRGFMNKQELMSVLDNYKLLSGVSWTLPILLQIDKKDINFGKGETIAFEREKDRDIYAVINVSDIEKIDLYDVCRRWFGTDDKEHPGVAKVMAQGDYIVSGEVFLIKKPVSDLDSYSLSPKQTRQIFRDQGWQKIVGFHTRNVIHRGHEFVQKKALESVKADALFISPVIGHKKSSDFSAEAIIRCYEAMIENNYYGSYPALLGAFSTYSRYSGPREAVFTALCRKNFGCSHFVVGRDHTGVGNYYPPDASHRIFDKIDNLGIVPLRFNAAYFCEVCSKHVDNCSHNKENHLSLSGTKVRKHLLDGKEIPEYLMRKNVSKALKEMSDKSQRLFEGDSHDRV